MFWHCERIQPMLETLFVYRTIGGKNMLVVLMSLIVVLPDILKFLLKEDCQF